MEKMAERLPNATLHIIEKAGHLVNSEAPEMGNTAIEPFYDA